MHPQIHRPTDPQIHSNPDVIYLRLATFALCHYRSLARCDVFFTRNVCTHMLCFVSDDAMEAWRCLLKAACAESVHADVYLALGNLHYLWGDLLDFGRRAELGAEGAARSVVADIKELRKQALRKRQMAPASRSMKRTPGDCRAKQTDRSSSNERGKFPTVTKDEKSVLEVDHPQAWEWYMKAAEQG